MCRNVQMFKFDKMFNRGIMAAMSRLSIEIDKEQHRQIKSLATFAGMSIKDFILQKSLPQERQVPDATTALLSSPGNARRLRQALKTPRSQHLAFESLKDLKDALGI